MSVSLLATARAFRERFDAKSARHGIIYPWWIGVASKVLQLGCAFLALGQRDLLVPPSVWAASILLIVGVHAAQAIVHAWVPWWVTAPVILVACSLIFASPGDVAGATDLAPGIMAILVAEITATDGWKAGMTTGATALAVIATATGSEFLIPSLEVLLGFVAGTMLWWQMRALVAERAARTGERARATLAERQRIAHEIHDLVAHSLSVTMLHVTGARRALEEDQDIPDAVAALVDAEQIGRQAMTDIRRTVGVLASEGSPVMALPGAHDVPRLVEEFRSAGLHVTYAADDGIESFPDAAGLGFYRIVQESLANIAKHAPTASAQVRIGLQPDHAFLTVRNRLPSHHPTRDGLGSGIDGMAARAEQLGGELTAGPDGRDWVVRLTIPVDNVTWSSSPMCPVRRKTP